jgi:hypothetical protein
MSGSYLIFRKDICRGLGFENLTLSLDKTDLFLGYLTILFQLQNAYNIELEIIMTGDGVRIWKEAVVIDLRVERLCGWKG